MSETTDIAKAALESVEVQEVVKQEAGSKLSLEDALKKITDYEADASKNADLLKKLRKYEKENLAKAEREAVEAGKFKDLYESAKEKLTEMETKIRTSVVDSALKDALTEAKVKSIPTVLKLIDRSKVELLEDGSINPKSVESLLKELRTTDPIFFEGTQAVGTSEPATTQRTVVVPSLHRAGEGQVKDSFTRELGAAKTMAEVRNVWKAYQGKI
jgi:hypothetical protein